MFTESMTRILYCYPANTLHLRKNYVDRLQEAADGKLELCENVSNLEKMDLLSNCLMKCVIIDDSILESVNSPFVFDLFTKV